MNELTIRLAVENDLPDLYDLYATLEGDGAVLTDRETFHSQFVRLRMNPDFFVYVAELDGRVAGTFELLIMQNLAHRCMPSAIVEDVVVHADLRGQGIGKGMMQHAMQIARERGCYKLVLSSNLKRESAHRFYESLGFEKHGYSFLVEL
jgi:GNAT superfamily N-acetyltransferase